MADQDPVQDAGARAHYVSGFGYISHIGRLTDGPADSDLDPPPSGLARSYLLHDTYPATPIRQHVAIQESGHSESDTEASQLIGDVRPSELLRGHPIETQPVRHRVVLPRGVPYSPQMDDQPDSLYYPDIGLTNQSGLQAIRGDNEVLRQSALDQARSRLRRQQLLSQFEQEALRRGHTDNRLDNGSNREDDGQGSGRPLNSR